MLLDAQPELPKKKNSNHPVKLLLILLGYGVTFFLVNLLVAALIFFIIKGDNAELLLDPNLNDWQSLTIMYATTAISALLVSGFFRRYVDGLEMKTFGFLAPNGFQNLLIGIGWAALILSLSALIIWGAGAVTITQTDLNGWNLAGFLLFFLIVAVGEEILFRGYLIPLIDDYFSQWVAVLVSAILFALVHQGNDFFGLAGLLNLFLGGVLLGLIFIYQKSIYGAIGFHWIWNFYQGNILGFGVSGLQVDGWLEAEPVGQEWLSGGNFGQEGSLATSLLLLLFIGWYVNRNKLGNTT